MVKHGEHGEHGQNYILNGLNWAYAARMFFLLHQNLLKTFLTNVSLDIYFKRVSGEIPRLTKCWILIGSGWLARLGFLLFDQKVSNHFLSAKWSADTELCWYLGAGECSRVL